MPHLSIKNFSCIKDADINLGKLNVIIGPQGSGKSVTIKLIYFFADLPRDALRHVEDGTNWNDYKKQIQKAFTIWFPPSAWGGERFYINYSDENYSIRVMRRTSGKVPTDDVTIKLSGQFEEAYRDSMIVFSNIKNKNLGESERKDGSPTRDALEIYWRAGDDAWSIFRKRVGENIVNSQTFIPAGRAFFTSIGRLVAGIEHAGSLDPATLKFAKIFAAWRDQLQAYRTHFDDLGHYMQMRERVMNELFDGVVQSKRELEYIEMRDGRKVPFSSLSSGQQELLPIWYFIDNLMLFDSFNTRRKRVSSGIQLIYIEEPEAHLFPESQSRLLDTLVEVVLAGSKARSLIVTTHSPYIMSRLNVLLKAGQISRRKKKNKDLNDIVERSKWLQSADVVALTIDRGVVKSIMDSDLGLIDASFLDSISEGTAKQFSALLDLEEMI